MPGFIDSLKLPCSALMLNTHQGQYAFLISSLTLSGFLNPQRSDTGWVWLCWDIRPVISLCRSTLFLCPLASLFRPLLQISPLSLQAPLCWFIGPRPRSWFPPLASSLPCWSFHGVLYCSSSSSWGGGTHVSSDLIFLWSVWPLTFNHSVDQTPLIIIWRKRIWIYFFLSLYW